MADTLNLNAQKRTLLGRKVKRLRKQDIIPANIFGKKITSLTIQVSLKDFLDTFAAVGETGLVNLLVDKTTHPVLITNVQSDPVTDRPVHVDFREVDLTEKVTASIPLEFIGESPAVKELGGVLLTPLDEIEVEALPADLPDSFVVDLSKLEKVGDTFSVSDLKVGSKVVVQTELDSPVALVQEHKEEKEPEPEEAPSSEEEATNQDTQQEAESTDSPQQASESDKPKTESDSKKQD